MLVPFIATTRSRLPRRAASTPTPGAQRSGRSIPSLVGPNDENAATSIGGPTSIAPTVITEGVTPSLHIDYKHSTIKQYHKEGRALRTETTINDTRDFGIGKRLTNLPALREIGFSANRRLLGVQRLSHNPIRAAEAFNAVHDPIVTDTGARIAGLRLGDRRAHALLQALLVFRLLPAGSPTATFAPCSPSSSAANAITAGQMSYDLRRLRAHGLIIRIPRSHRYRLTETGLHHAMLLNHIHTRLLLPGLAQLADPDPPAPSTATHRRPQLPAGPRSTHPGSRTRRMTPRLDSILPTSSASASQFRSGTLPGTDGPWRGS